MLDSPMRGMVKVVSSRRRRLCHALKMMFCQETAFGGRVEICASKYYPVLDQNESHRIHSKGCGGLENIMVGFAYFPLTSYS